MHVGGGEGGHPVAAFGILDEGGLAAQVQLLLLVYEVEGVFPFEGKTRQFGQLGLGRGAGFGFRFASIGSADDQILLEGVVGAFARGASDDSLTLNVLADFPGGVATEEQSVVFVLEVPLVFLGLDVGGLAAAAKEAG